MIAKYRRLYPYAPYLNEEIGFERSIPDDSTDEEMIDAVIKLKAISDKAHEKINPHLSTPSAEYSSEIKQEEIQVEKIEIGNLPNQIASCTSVKVLESYKLLVRGKPDLEQLYLDKLEELSPQK